ncbi:MAG: hypothetical protein ACTS3F_06430 [Phycisphaerales bacterium]
MSARSLPLMSRNSYVWELRSAALLPAALACVEAGVIGVIAQQVFGAPAFLIALLAAAPALANITSVLLVRAMRGMDRTRFANLMQLALVGCVALIAVAPASEPYRGLGLALMTIGALGGRCAATGIITARAELWRANYDRKVRARATGNLSIVAILTITGTSVLAGVAMDRGGGVLPFEPYRAVYLLAVAMGLCGAWLFSHVRWRGGPAQLSIERIGAGTSERRSQLSAMIGVLREDRRYRSYMLAQFLLGLPNLAAVPVFIVALDAHSWAGSMLGDPSTGALSSTVSIALTQVIPIAVPIVFIPVWARLLDKVHVIRFRAWHSWFFVGANLLTGLGFMFDSLPVIFAARVVLGIAFAGGMLAWNLGHNDFASRELSSIYMGIHVTLTGVRGAIGPFLGVLLFTGVLVPEWLSAWVPDALLSAARVDPVRGASAGMGSGSGGVGDAGARSAEALANSAEVVAQLGNHSFFVFAGAGAIAAMMFVRMARGEPKTRID